MFAWLLILFPFWNKPMNERGSTMYVFLMTLVAALGGLLFGYDTAVISGAIGFLEEHFRMDVQVESGFAAGCALLGCALGAGLGGFLGDRFGRKGMLVFSAIAFFVSAVGTAFPQNVHQFIIFRIIGGLGIGIASMTSPMYIAEIAPARIRGRMISINQFAIVTGMVAVYFINFFIADYGKRVDRVAAEQVVAESGQTLELAQVELQIDRLVYVKHPDNPAKAEALRQKIAAELKPIEGNLTSSQVEAILKTHNIKVDPDALFLKCKGRESWNEVRGWRWMFGSGIFPSGVFLLLLLFVPESPRWLAGKNREKEALAILRRVGGPQHAQAELADIRSALSLETGTLREIFQPGLRLVLMLGVILAVLQQVTGINVFLYFAPKIFAKMGSEANAALLEQAIVGAVNMLFTVLAIWSVDLWGRKPLMLIGFLGMGISLIAMGAAAFIPEPGLWVLIFILGYIACFALSVGPVTWVILAEIFPTRVRGRAMAIATVSLWVANYFVTQTFTMMNENTWLVDNFHGGFPFFVYALLCVVGFLFTWRFIPETKGKTLEEIERRWLH